MATHYNKWEPGRLYDRVVWEAWAGYYHATAAAQVDAESAWQAAFDNVLAGVDEELLDAIHGMVEYMRWDYPDDFYFPGYRDNEYEYAKWNYELPF